MLGNNRPRRFCSIGCCHCDTRDARAHRRAPINRIDELLPGRRLPRQRHTLRLDSRPVIGLGTKVRDGTRPRLHRLCVSHVFGNQSDRAYILSVLRRLTYTAAAWTGNSHSRSPLKNVLYVLDYNAVERTRTSAVNSAAIEVLTRWDFLSYPRSYPAIAGIGAISAGTACSPSIRG
jgi:hypothetical protein